MRRFHKISVMVAVLAALGLMAESVSADPASDEDRFVQLINASRAAHGFGPVNVDGNLVGAARAQSQRMANAGTIFHNGNLPHEVPGGWQTLGENVGTGGSVDDLHNAFMNSPSHKANVLGNYDRVGVGIVMVGAQYYVTEVFWKTAVAPVPTAGAAAPAAAAVAKSCRKVRRRTICRRARRAKRVVRRRRADAPMPTAGILV